MPIPIPNLDDRNYNQLLNETAGVIARYFPEYADIGASDPAMAVNELFCYLFDIAVYQINRITPDTRDNFAALLGIRPVYGRPPEESLRQAHAKLSRVERAITPEDIEAVIKKVSADRQVCSAPVKRVCVIPGDPVRVFILQEKRTGSPKRLKSEREADLRSLYKCLRERSPLGTHYLLAHASILGVGISAEVVKRRDSTISDESLRQNISNRLGSFFGPFTGGDLGKGWEFGKAVSRGDIYGLIEGMSGVDHVKSLLIKKSDDGFFGTADTLPLAEGELIELTQVSVLVL